MSNGHLPEDVLARLRSGELPAEEVGSALRHLSSCRDCASSSRTPAAIAESAGLLRRTVGQWQEEEHLDADSEMFPFVDGRLDPVKREIVESHLEDCETCRAEVADLRSLRRRAAERKRRIAIAAMAAAAAAALVIVIVQPFTPSETTVPLRAPAQVSRPPIAPAPARSEPAAAPAGQYENPAWQSAVRTSVETKTLPFPDLTELSRPAGVLRGNARGSAPSLEPAGVVVDDPRPRFSWPAYDGAQYVVVLFRDDAEVMRSATLATTHWRPARDLGRGARYVWQVYVTSGETTNVIPAPPAPVAVFRVAAASDHEEIVTARRMYPQDHLLHAVLYARMGLREEARDALRRAAAAGDRDAAAILDRASR